MHQNRLAEDDQERIALLKKLQFKSRYMGNKENDLFFETFSQSYLPSFSLEQLRLYETLLQENDIFLTQWVMGKKPIPEAYQDLEPILAQHYAGLKDRR